MPRRRLLGETTLGAEPRSRLVLLPRSGSLSKNLLITNGLEHEGHELVERPHGISLPSGNGLDLADQPAFCDALWPDPQDVRDEHGANHKDRPSIFRPLIREIPLFLQGTLEGRRWDRVHVSSHPCSKQTTRSSRP